VWGDVAFVEESIPRAKALFSLAVLNPTLKRGVTFGAKAPSVPGRKRTTWAEAVFWRVGGKHTLGLKPTSLWPQKRLSGEILFVLGLAKSKGKSDSVAEILFVPRSRESKSNNENRVFVALRMTELF
jgi:hypothetical protein